MLTHSGTGVDSGTTAKTGKGEEMGSKAAAEFGRFVSAKVIEYKKRPSVPKALVYYPEG